MYSETMRQFSVRNRDVLIIDYSPHTWWSTFKSAVFGLSSLLPQLVGGDGGLAYKSVGEADPMSDNFCRKQSRESVDLPLASHPSPRTFALMSSDLRRLLLDLVPYGGTNPLGMFPLFLKRTTNALPPPTPLVVV